MIEKLYEIRRGSICELLDHYEIKDGQVLEWMDNNNFLCEKLYGSGHLKYLLVMKRLPEDMLLVASVFDKPVKEAKAIKINGRRYYARFEEFIVIPKGMTMVAGGKRLDGGCTTVTAIYDTHRRFKRRDWRMKHREAYGWSEEELALDMKNGR